MNFKEAILEREHKFAGDKHLDVGDHLKEIGEIDWARVCYFYASLRYFRGTFLRDKIFDDPKKLKAIDPDLNIQARNSTAHMYFNTYDGDSTIKTLGTTQVVDLVYDTLSPNYLHLYKVSLYVRYSKGKPTSLDVIDVVESQKYAKELKFLYEKDKIKII